MSELVRRYREYYREQTPAAFDSLFSCMIDYDFSSYQDDMRKVRSMHSETKCIGEFSALKSGGSLSGEDAGFYFFGPNFDHICWSVEKFLRLGQHKTILLADPSFGGESSIRVIVDSETTSSWYDLSITADWTSDEGLAALDGHIEEFYRDSGLVNISSLFNLWLFFTNDPAFRDLVRRNLGKINCLVNSDGPATFNEIECRTHDQMMDWASGTNFYQCPAGGMHFLPTFFNYGCCNSSLLNLKKTSKPFDDLFVLREESFLCGCGRNSIPFSFLPHVSSQPLDALGEIADFSLLPRSMWPGVLSFQVLQNAGKTSILYSCRDGTESGLSGVLDALESLNLGKMDFVRAKYFMAGRKRPFVWRGGPSAVYDFFERRVPWRPRS